MQLICAICVDCYNSCAELLEFPAKYLLLFIDPIIVDLVPMRITTVIETAITTVVSDSPATTGTRIRRRPSLPAHGR